MRWNQLRVGCFITFYDVVWEVTHIYEDRFDCVCIIAKYDWKIGVKSGDSKTNIELFTKLSPSQVEVLKAELL